MCMYLHVEALMHNVFKFLKLFCRYLSSYVHADCRNDFINVHTEHIRAGGTGYTHVAYYLHRENSKLEQTYTRERDRPVVQPAIGDMEKTVFVIPQVQSSFLAPGHGGLLLENLSHYISVAAHIYFLSHSTTFILKARPRPARLPKST